MVLSPFCPPLGGRAGTSLRPESGLSLSGDHPRGATPNSLSSRFIPSTRGAARYGVVEAAVLIALAAYFAVGAAAFLESAE